MQKTTIKLTLIICALMFFASACHSNIRYKGHLVSSESIDKIKPNMTKQQILDILGSPSSKSAFGNESWYYIHEKTHRTSRIKDDIEFRNVVALHFNKNGRFVKIVNKTNNDIKDVEFNSEATPVKGDDDGLLKEFFSNFRKFNKKQQVER